MSTVKSFDAAAAAAHMDYFIKNFKAAKAINHTGSLSYSSFTATEQVIWMGISESPIAKYSNHYIVPAYDLYNGDSHVSEQSMQMSDVCDFIDLLPPEALALLSQLPEQALCCLSIMGPTCRKDWPIKLKFVYPYSTLKGCLILTVANIRSKQVLNKTTGVWGKHFVGS